MIERRKGARGKRWWDEECREEKKKVRKELIRWRRGRGSGESYRKEKARYRKLCEKKKKEETWERNVKEARTKGQVWKIVNRERRRRFKINEGIKLEEWDEHFKRVLGGIKWRVRLGSGR